MVISTASHRKFPEATKEAGIKMEADDEMEALVKKETKFDWMKKGEDWEGMLRKRIEHITERNSK